LRFNERISITVHNQQDHMFMPNHLLDGLTI
jgi:hypothetical protein